MMAPIAELADDDLRALVRAACCCRPLCVTRDAFGFRMWRVPGPAMAQRALAELGRRGVYPHALWKEYRREFGTDGTT